MNSSAELSAAPAAEWGAGDPGLDVMARTLRARLDVYYQNQPTTLIALFVAVASVALVFWDVVPTTPFAVWLAVMLLLTVLRSFLYQGYMRRRRADPADEDEAGKFWAYAAVAGSGVSSWVWGAVVFLVYVPGDLGYQAFIGAVLLCMAALAVPAVGAYPLALNVTVSGLLIPLGLRSLAEMTVPGMVLGAASFALLAITMLFGRRLALQYARFFDREEIHDAQMARAVFCTDLLENIVDSIDQGAAAFDSQGRLRLWNSRFEAFSGLPRDMIGEGAAYSEMLAWLAQAGVLPGGKNAVAQRLEQLRRCNVDRFDLAGDGPERFRAEVQGGQSGGFVVLLSAPVCASAGAGRAASANG